MEELEAAEAILDHIGRQRREQEMYDDPQIGDIFRTSWGYDQTNVEFFQVVARSAKSVKLRRISMRYDETTRRVYPVKNGWARDYGLDGNASYTYTDRDGNDQRYTNPVREAAEKAGYSQTGWRRIDGHAFRIDTIGYIRHAFAYTGGGAWDTLAAGQPGH
jgi:hypothetical protein